MLEQVRVAETTEQSCYLGALRILPANVRSLIENLPRVVLQQLEEIRLRQGRPLAISQPEGDYFLDKEGRLTKSALDAYLVSREDLEKATQLVSGSSLYALEEELRNGFITLPGGYRVGITGKALLENGKVRTIKYISNLNIRISREVFGAASKVLPYLIKSSQEIYNTLIFSPPCCGKTTLLRDLIRQLSNGIPELNFSGVKIGLVDERSEIAGCYHGVPQLNVGVRTDILDGCPKKEGLMMLVRAMGPQVLATDEIGRQEDITALEDALCAGVKVISTAHGSSFVELVKRPAMDYLFNLNVIERFILLGRSRGVGTVESITDSNNKELLEVESC